ncbi:uncharacterized protein B0P05DRAFT_543255 [Gilbertella persicaria]|uniref:uncharacterized protein n=1 Tax=Gilbertella persicaria TaxID=101096 RepID=UPI00221E7B64|nr:uncharacterized protein B0P05DRAFT_543255 [Gilbertella persicaria]KAI8077895.1 hypothetical protein B0P05DRAFT_543255 [Gilbertella persicaria]
MYLFFMYIYACMCVCMYIYMSTLTLLLETIFLHPYHVTYIFSFCLSSVLRHAA